MWTRWGRVGENGANKLQPFNLNEAGAIKDFEKKFKDKTKNAWGDLSTFKKIPGKYQLVETEETEGDDSSVPLGKLSKVLLLYFCMSDLLIISFYSHKSKRVKRFSSVSRRPSMPIRRRNMVSLNKVVLFIVLSLLLDYFDVV